MVTRPLRSEPDPSVLNPTPPLLTRPLRSQPDPSGLTKNGRVWLVTGPLRSQPDPSVLNRTPPFSTGPLRSQRFPLPPSLLLSPAPLLLLRPLGTNRRRPADLPGPLPASCAGKEGGWHQRVSGAASEAPRVRARTNRLKELSRHRAVRHSLGPRVGICPSGAGPAHSRSPPRSPPRLPAATATEQGNVPRT